MPAPVVPTTTEISVTSTTTIEIAAAGGSDVKNRLHSCVITAEGEWDIQWRSDSTDIGGAHNLTDGGSYLLEPPAATGIKTSANEALNLVATLISGSGTLSGHASYVAK